MNSPGSRVYAVVRFELPRLTPADLETLREDTETEELFGFLRARVGGPDSRCADPSPFPWHIDRVEVAP